MTTLNDYLEKNADRIDRMIHRYFGAVHGDLFRPLARNEGMVRLEAEEAPLDNLPLDRLRRLVGTQEPEREEPLPVAGAGGVDVLARDVEVLVGHPEADRRTRAAREEGIAGFKADVLENNRAMLKVYEKALYPVQTVLLGAHGMRY